MDQQRVKTIKRRLYRMTQAVAVVVALAMTLTAADPGEASPTRGWPAIALPSLLDVRGMFGLGPVAWKGLPQQDGGSADGQSHDASSADTRAGGGAGRPLGTGQGELPAYQPSAPRFTAGPSAPAAHGYDPKTSVRVPEKSSATMTYFRNTDGSYSRRFSEGRSNYQDASGKWQPIDAGIAAAAGGGWSEKANSVGVRFADAADDAGLVSLTLDSGHSLSYGLSGAAHVTGTSTGSAVTYGQVLPDTDLRLTPTPAGVKEDVVLRSAAAASSWTFPLTLRGLTAASAADGAIGLVDGAGKTVGTIPAGYAYDSTVDPTSGEHSGTRSVGYRLVTEPGRTDLVMSLDAAWLHDPKRTFPVTVDPTFRWDVLTTYAETGNNGDHSMEQFIKIGSYDSGVHSARSFLQFPGLGIDGSHATVSGAELDLYVVYANGCPNAQQFDVAPVTEPWTAGSVTSYPGPALGASIGSYNQETYFACQNPVPVPDAGDPIQVPLAVDTFNAWSTGAKPDYGLGIYASTTDSLHWKYFASMNAWGFVTPGLLLTYAGFTLPQVLVQRPTNGAAVQTLTPLLTAEATVDPSLGVAPQYRYQVFTAGGAQVVDSGVVSGSYLVPAGKLQWGQTYFWTVLGFDGTNYTASPTWYQLSTQVPQPAVTSSLSQTSSGHGFDPSIGNYTNSATDADVASVGPALSVVRDYNSRDPRSGGGFGAAWSSIVDTRVAERYDATGAVSHVVVTYPDGSEVGFGRNADGSFTAPAGRAATLIRLTNGYELIDKAGSTYTFSQSLGSGAYGIASVADANGRAETFGWSSGHVGTMTSVVSGRALHLTWTTPSGATTAHVSTVVTDPAVAGQPTSAYTWTYGYTGDRLVSVCPPGTSTQCTRYAYDPSPASQTRNQVLDLGAQSYWPLAETSGTTAYSVIPANEGADNGTYANVTLGTTAGPLPGTAAKVATFNGTSSQVTLPDLKMSAAIVQSVSLWFKAAPGAPAGVLYSYSDFPIRAQTNFSGSMPVIYLGTSGKLHGSFWMSGPNHTPNPITTAGAVADGAWHHVLLTGSQSAQKMYVDGALVGTIGGWGVLGWPGPQADTTHFTYLGTGFLGPSPWGMGGWPDEPYESSTQAHYATYFTGSMADASFHTAELTAADAVTLHDAGLRPGTLLTTLTRQSGKAYAAVTYDPVSATVKRVTDENGGNWTLAAPVVTGSSQVYRSAVLGCQPVAYYRLGDAAGATQAKSEVKYTAGTYGSTTLGVPGRFTDNPGAAFNGSSSYLQLPNSLVNGNGSQTISLWFNTTHPDGVLFSYQQSALSAGTTTGGYVPALYVGSSGKLRGTFWPLPQITSTTTVTDGKWHHVVLAGGTTTQSMYLDGTPVGTTTGTMTSPQSLSMNTDYVGAGYIGGGWADTGHAGASPATPTYFNGTISEVSYYRSQLSAAQVAAQWLAAHNSLGLGPMTTVTVTDPGNKTLTYQSDPVNGNRPIAQIDGRGYKTTYGYDTSGFLYTVTDPNGAVQTTGHDADGNVVSRSTCQNQSANTCSTTYFTYKPNTMGQDQAKGATVTASGSVVASGWSPGAAVDGNTASVSGALGWTSNPFSAPANTAWIQLDMGTARTIDRVDLYPRNDSPNLGLCFPQAFTVAVSADGTTWTTVTTQANYPQPTTPAAATFGFSPTSVRYLKVTGTTLRSDGSSYYMQFAEVAALNDWPDPTAGERLTVRDPRSTSAADNTYLTTYTYDAIGNVTAVTTPPVPGFPAGRTSAVAYTDGSTVVAADTGLAPAGLPYRTTSAAGAANTISYLHNGDVASTTDADGLVTGYTYDPLGRVLSRKVTSDTFPAGLVTAYGYDGESRVTSEVDPAVTNRVTGAIHTPHVTTVFDADGNPTSQTVADDTGGDSSRSQSTTYNTFNQVATSLDAMTRSTSYTYDSYGHRLTETDPQGTVTAYTYDANGNLLTKAINNYTGDPVSPSPAAKMTQESRAYDPANRLSSITDAMGRKTSYTYTDDGLLASVVRRDSAGLNPYTFKQDSYDAAANLVKEVTDNGGTTTTRTVDAASRPTVSTLDPTGVNRTTRISYTPDDAVATSTSSDAAGATQVTSATYDPMGRVTSRSVYSDAAGHPVGWWPLNQAAGATVVDASGTGNAVATNAGVTWSGGAASFNGTTGAATTAGPVLNTAQSFSVSAWVNIASTATWQTMVGQDGAHASGFNLQWDFSTGKWAFSHNNSDANGVAAVRAESSAAAALNAWTQLVGTYDSTNGAWKLYVNGALSASTSITGPWNASGPLTIGRGQSGSAASDFTLGSVGNVQTYQRALSATDVSTLYGAGRTGGTVASSSQVTTSWTLDRRGLATAMTDAKGSVTSYNYDEAGHLVLTTAPTVNVEVGGGAPTAVHPVTTRGFNTFGNPTEIQDPNGNTATSVFDPIGRVVSRTMPNYTPPGASTPIVATTVYTYDEVGNLTQVSDPLTHLTSYVYNQQGDLAKVTASDGGITHHVYDNDGERLSTTGPTGAQVQSTYDHLGRTLTTSELDRYPSPTTSTTTNSYASSTTNPGGSWLASSTTQSGVVTRYGYNAAGETTSVTDGAANVTKYQYDFIGRTVGTVAPDNTANTVAYNQTGNPVSVTDKDAGGTVLRTTTATYDAVGNLLSATDGRGFTTTFGYDASGSLTQEIQPVTATTGITTTFGYDAAGNRTRFTDGRNNSWITTYNRWNLPETVVEPATATYSTAANRTTTTVYDAAARPVSATLPGGVTITAGFDAASNLTSQSAAGAEAATASRTFGYDLVGQLTSAATAAAGGAAATSETFTYNDRGELLTAAGSGGASSFGYTADGLMASRADVAGTTAYTYDAADRLSTIADPTTGTTLTYGYNTLSDVSSIAYGTGGDVRSFGYDGLHRLTADTLKTAGGATVASIGYGYDANSNVTSKTTMGFAGAAANTYTYDQANRLLSWSNGTATVNYGYDASGNRTQVGTAVYTYDARDQLTGDGTNTYAYSARGTLQTQTSTAGTVTSTSDAYGQAISQGTATQGTQTYAYDALGRALKVTPTTGTATSFAYSGTDNTLSSDTDNNYSRDPEGSLVGVAAASGGVLAYLDAHTDVVGDFQATASALNGSTAYDPLGQVLASINQAGALRYQSGWTDTKTGRVNMDARWYNPAVGQFTNKDTIASNPVPNSAEANPFAYVDDNPLTGADPSGHGWFSSLTSAVSSTWNNVTSTVSSAYHATTSYVSSYVSSAWNTATSYVDDALDWARNTYHAVVNTVKDVYQKAVTVVKQVYHATTNYVKKQVTNVVHAVATTYHAVTDAVSTAAHAVARVGDATIELATNVVEVSASYVKNHAAAITSFVVSTVAFMGCEAVLGAVTAGVGAVAGAVACGAFAGAVGGLVTQGFKCAGGGQGACSVGSFVQAGIVGGVIGGVSGLGGALGGKLLSAVGGKAMSAIGGLFGRGGAAVEGGTADIATGLSNRAGAGADNALTSGAEDAARATPRAGGRPGTEEPGAGGGGNGGGGGGVKSTNPSTPDLLKAIAGRAERKIGGSGGVAGTNKHTYAKTLLDRYQNIYGSRGLQTEVSYSGGFPVKYGTSGSARVDVLDLANGVAYDYKFVLRPPGLKPAQINKILRNVPGINKVVEINP